LIWTPGPLELAVLLVIVMIFFGVGKLPQVGQALGRSLREFKSAQRLDAPDEAGSQTVGTEAREVREAR